jgi:hypothetical protein
MTCSICGKATGPGALLCRPCKAALKRARHLTVQDFPGTPATVTMPGFLPSLQRSHATPARAVAPRADAGDTRRRLLLAAIAIALLAAAAYVGQRGMAADEPGSEHAAVPTASKPAPPPAAPPVAPTIVAPTVVGTDLPVAAPPPSRALAARNAPPAAARPAAKARMAFAPVPPPASLPEVRSAAVEVAEPVPPLPVLPAPPPPDRWQTMADSLKRCENEGGFSGFICDQRVRLESCEGYWGRVAQCPNPPENPR